MRLFSSSIGKTCNWCNNIPCTCPKPTPEELAKYHEECRIEMSKVYSQEGCPDIHIRDRIMMWDKVNNRQIQEYWITNIEDEKLYCRMITNEPMKDPHQGAEFVWKGEMYKVIR